MQGVHISISVTKRSAVNQGTTTFLYVAEQVYRGCTQLDKWLDAEAEAKTTALFLQIIFCRAVIRLNHFNAALTGYLAWECITL